LTEAALSEVKSIFGRVVLLYAVIWLALLLGGGTFWGGSPVGWFDYQGQSCLNLWGLPFLVIHAVIIYRWIYTDSLRIVILSIVFVLHALQAWLVEMENQNHWDIFSILGGGVLVAILAVLLIRPLRRLVWK
jgi:thiol:disulfide interchange protein